MTIFGTLWPKQNHPVIWLRHNGRKQTPCDSSIDVLFGYVDNGPFSNVFHTKSLLLLLLPYFGFLFRSQLRQKQKQNKKPKTKKPFQSQIWMADHIQQTVNTVWVGQSFHNVPTHSSTHSSACKRDNSWIVKHENDEHLFVLPLLTDLSLSCPLTLSIYRDRWRSHLR